LVNAPRARDAGLVLGFGTAVAMWAIGFVARMSPAAVPGPAVAFLLIACLVGAGVRAGRTEGLGARGGALAGTIASLVNLLILGSLLGGDEPNRLVPSAALWIPGSIVFGAACGAVGAVAARALDGVRTGSGTRPRPPRSAADWTAELARVAFVATVFLVAIGGLVTSREAGLAVVDWPNSYGYGMFLYPLSRMVGGIYYEHSHRLFGSLVGLTTLVLCVRLLLGESRRGVRWLGVAALALVIGQGILGGLRVTGHFTLSDDPLVTRPSLLLATIHGFVGQVFLAGLAALAVVTTPAWRDAPVRRADFRLALATIAVLLVQLVLGIRARHLGEGIAWHVGGAIVAIGLITWTGARALRQRGRPPVLPVGGAVLLGLGWLQVILGMITLVVLTIAPGEGPSALAEVTLATLHQTVGALLLAAATVLALLSARFPVDSTLHHRSQVASLP
jgi:cytochrome c oxidase assembly protein subunit 15